VFAKALLSNEIRRGDRVKLDAENFKLIVNP